MKNTHRELTKLQTLQLIHAALMMGIVMFFGVFLLQFFTSQSASPLRMNDRPVFDSLAMVNFSLLAGVMIAQAILPSILLKNTTRKLPKGLSEDAFITSIFPGLSTSHIVKLALLETPALFSIVIMLIHTSELKHSPILWINGIPALLCFILMALSFPTASRHTMQVKEEFAIYSAGR